MSVFWCACRLLCALLWYRWGGYAARDDLPVRVTLAAFLFGALSLILHGMADTLRWNPYLFGEVHSHLSWWTVPKEHRAQVAPV